MTNVRRRKDEFEDLPVQRMTCYRRSRLNTDTKGMMSAFLCSNSNKKVEGGQAERRGIVSCQSIERNSWSVGTPIGRTSFSNLFFYKRESF
jgi:hypothetical protein